MFENSLPWYRDASVHPFPPQFSDGRGYFSYEDRGVLSADTATGEIDWTYATNLSYRPFFHDGYICCPNEQTIELVDTHSGEPVGQLDFNDSFTGQPIATPHQSLYLAGCDDGYLYAKDTDGILNWKAELDHTPSEMVPLSREVLVGYYIQSLDTFDLRTGSTTWGYHLPAPVSAGPVSTSRWFSVGLENGVVYMFSQGNKQRIDSWRFDWEIVDIATDGDAMIVATDNELSRISTDARSIDWSITLNGTCRSVVTANGVIYIGMDDGSIALHKSDSGKQFCCLDCELHDDELPIGFNEKLYFGIPGHGYAVLDDPTTYSETITLDEWPVTDEHLFGHLDETGTIHAIGGSQEGTDSLAQTPPEEKNNITDTEPSPTSTPTQKSDEADLIDTTTPSIADAEDTDSTDNAPWVAEIDPSSYPPTIADGDVYVSTTGGTLEMFDGATGELIWNVRISDSFSTKPHVYANQLILLCEDNTVRTFDRTDGDEIFRLDLSSHRWDSLEILDSIVCIAASDGALVGVDLDAEAVIWERSFDQSVHLSPFNAASKFNISIGNGLYRIDPEQGTTLLHCDTGSKATATAVHSGDIYYGTPTGSIQIIDILSLRSDGKLMFDSAIEAIIPGKNTLFIVTDKEIHSVDANTYETTWTEAVNDPTEESLALYNDHIIVADASGHVIVGNPGGERTEEVQLETDHQLSVITDSNQILFQDESQFLGVTDPETPESLVEAIQRITVADSDASEQDTTEETESELEETVAELEEIVTTKNKQLSKLNDTLKAKNERIETLEGTLESKDQRISTLSQDYNNVLENTVRPLLECLIRIHVRWFDHTSNESDKLEKFIENTLRQNDVSIEEPAAGDDYSPEYHDKVKTIQGAHPPDTIVAIQSPCYEWKVNDTVLHPAEVVVSDGSQSLEKNGIVNGDVTEVDGAKCVYEGSIPDAPQTTTRVLSLSGVDSEELIEQFAAAVRQWEQLGRHPNTVNPIAWDTEPVPWVAHELESYQHLPNTLSSLGRDARTSVIADVAESLRNADKYNTRHPSLDIQSVWLDTETRDVTAAVADWGVQDLFRKAGTQSWSQYAAPEQVTDDPIGSHTNIYRLGAFSYHLLSGQPPFSEVTDPIEPAIVEQTPSPPSEYADNLPGRVDEIILQAMASDPAERFDSVYSFRVELLNAF